MLKVAAIVPPASMNLGNDFFSMGGITAFRNVFPESEITFIEFFDSGEKWFNTMGGLTPMFTPSTLRWIENHADLIVLFGGCCLHKNLKHLFDALFSTGKPFVGWGLSPTSYNQDDVQFAKYVADNSKLLITRDDIIAKMVGNYPNFMSGLDGGWWMGESYHKPEKTSDYYIVNIEKGNSLDIGRAIAERNLLKKFHPDDPIYFISNNCERDYHFMDPDSLLITSSKHLYTTIANASGVITTRAHSTICCLANATPVRYIGETSKRVIGLMSSVGIDITDANELVKTQECFEKVQVAKSKFLEEVKNNLVL